MASWGESRDRGAGAIQDELPRKPSVGGTGWLGRTAPRRQGGAGGERKEYGRLGGDPAKVARVIRKIIRSRRPAFRYVVGPDARTAIAAKWLMPERLYLSLLSWATLK